MFSKNHVPCQVKQLLLTKFRQNDTKRDMSELILEATI